MQRLADAVATADGRRAVRLLAHIASTPPAGDARALSDPSPNTPAARIGIWQRTLEDGQAVYVRTASGEPRRFWADVERLTPARGRRPVVLLGESVARGYYYDPHYNPAAALTAVMEPAAAGCRDVVDLARIDCSRAMLLQLAGASLALGPAAWVVFAGNNWNPYLDLDLDDYNELATELAEPAGSSRVRRYMEDVCRRQVTAFVQTLATLSRDHGVAAVIVVPEFNLAGWRNEYGASIPLLGGAEAMRWQALRADAEGALARQQYERVPALVEQMLALDGGGAPRSLEMLAECRVAAGATAEARALFERARDASLSIPVRRSPRCFAVVQDTLRAAAGAHGIACVDLPRRFEEYLDGALPDSRLFHDYCHLTVEGIQVAMAHVGEALLPLIGGGQMTWRELYDGRRPVCARVRAEAHVMAALHNARWGQDYATIRRQCALAVDETPEIAGAMLQCLDFYVRRAPAVLCRTFDSLAKQGSLSAINFVALTGDPTREKLLNPGLVEALTDAASRFVPDAVARAGALLAEEHGLTERPVSLLATAYCCTSCADPEYGWHQRSAVFKAYGAESSFRVVLRTAAPITCRLAYRLPGAAARGDGRLEIAVNGVPAASLSCSGQWRAATVEVDLALLRSGWNTMTLHWPAPAWDADAQVRRLAASLDMGEIPDLFPVYGELHAFTAAASAAYV